MAASNHSMRNVLWSLLLLLATESCTQQATDKTGSIQHVRLGWAANKAPVLDGAVIRTIAIPAELRNWKPELGRPQQFPGQDGVRFQLWHRTMRVEIPGPIAPFTFARVVVHGTFQGQQVVQVDSVVGEDTRNRKTRSDALHSAAQVPGGGISVDLPELAFEQRPCDSLVVKVQGDEFEIHSIELVNVPLAATLPGPDKPRWFVVGNEARRSVGLSGGNALTGSFRAEKGLSLELCYALPEFAGDSLPGTELRIVLQSGRGRLERRMALQREGADQQAWKSLSLPLDSLAGSDVEASFELVGTEASRLACLMTEPLVGRRRKDAPVILLITSDTHRADHLGSARMGVGVRTPALDALANRGLSFEDCYSTSHITTPSHAAIFTGLSPRDTGVVNNAMHLVGSARTLGEVFQDAGYRAFSAVSAQFLIGEWSELVQGFEAQTIPLGSERPARDGVDDMLGWLDDLQGWPVFLWLHVYDPHFPYQPPDGFDRRYYPKQGDPFDPSLPDPAVDVSLLDDTLRGLKDMEFPRAQYKAEISYVDEQLGRLLAHPRIADAIVVATSDHGEALSRPDSLFKHELLAPCTLHVPLIISGPGVPVGERSSVPVVQSDVGRTLLDLAGLQGEAFPGRNLIAAARPASGTELPRFALADRATHASIRLGTWFLRLDLRVEEMKGWDLERHRVQLFDLAQDPLAVHDVAAQEAQTARRLRQLLVEWLCDVQEQTLAAETSLSDEQVAHLRALGYVADMELPSTSRWIDPACTCERCELYR